MLEVRFVELYANAEGVDRSVAERDIVLTYILKMMKEEGIIENLAFKGGTCIRKSYLGNLYLLKNQEHPKEEEIKNRILENYDYLSELDTNLDEIRSDNRKHRNEEEVNQLIKKLRK